MHTFVHTYVKFALAIQRGAQLYRCNNFNPLLFAAVNDSFPLKFTNGHKRRVAPTAQSAALFLFLSCLTHPASFSTTFVLSL